MLTKRILAMCLIGALSFGVSAVSAAAEENDLADEAAKLLEEVEADEEGTAGIYRLSTGFIDDEELTDEELALMESMGYASRLTLREDGTGVLDLFGEEQELEWDESDLIIEGDRAGYVLEDGELTLDLEDGDYMVFTKMTAEELENGVSTEARQPADYDPDTRAGYYTLSTIEEDGEVTDAAVLSLVGMEVYLVLEEDNTGLLSMFDIPVDLTWDEENLTFEDEDEEASSTAYAYDAGTITLDLEGTIMKFVYVGTPEEAPEPEEASESAEEDE